MEMIDAPKKRTEISCIAKSDIVNRKIFLSTETLLNKSFTSKTNWIITINDSDELITKKF